MLPINVEKLMDHKIGTSGSYYRPIEQNLVDDYLRAVSYLEINRDQKINTQLQKQFAELTEKSEQETHAIQEKLKEKETETEDSKNRIKELEASMRFYRQMHPKF